MMKDGNLSNDFLIRKHFYPCLSFINSINFCFHICRICQICSCLSRCFIASRPVLH